MTSDPHDLSEPHNPTHPARLANALGRLRPTLPPSPILAALSLCGFATEAILISCGQPSLYATDGVTIAFGLLYLGWFWLTVGWGLEMIGRGWTHWFHRVGWFGKLAAWSTLGVSAAVLVCGYAISWGLFFRAGRFANLETGRFLLFNFRQLWPYFREAEPVQLLLVVGLMVTGLVALPGFVYLSIDETRRFPTRQLRQPAIAWMTLAVAATFSWHHLPPQRSTLRQAVRQHALKHALNPSFSLYVSHLESRAAEPIKPTLQVGELRPLSSTAGYLTGQTSHDPLPSIIFVAVESLRYDTIHLRHQGQEVLPQINRLAKDGLHLTRAYAQSTHSDYADVCLVSSLYPLRTRRHHYYGPSDPWPVTRIYDVLKPLGYATAIISSQNEAWGGMDHFLASPNLDLFYHPETSQAASWVAPMDRGFSAEIEAGGLVAGKFPDSFTTDHVLAWIERQVREGKPFFLSMNLQSSHFPYLMPADVARPFVPHELPPDISFVDYPRDQVDVVRNAYYNAIHECDHQIGRLVARLAELQQLDNTILVITGENGEAFHECGRVTHASDPVEPAIHVACVIHAPRHLPGRVEDYPFEHVDLVPTVLGLVGLPPHPNFQGIDILAPDRPTVATRLTYCHVLSSLAEADTVMLAGQWKLTVDHRSGESTLFDVVTDPWQTHNICSQQPALAAQLRECLDAWRQRQLAYYHFPAYYLNYFPPAPPQFGRDAREQVH